jgi:hypothetical protein
MVDTTTMDLMMSLLCITSYPNRDSIFVPDEADKPFSQMSTDEKNGLSHRGKAVRLWADWLGTNKDELFRRQTGVRSVGHKGLDFKSISSEQ